MLRNFTIVSLVTALVWRTEGLQKKTAGIERPWFLGGSQQPKEVDPVQQIADKLEDQNLNLLRLIFDGTCTQADVNDFNGAVKDFKTQYLKYRGPGWKSREMVVNAMQAEVLKAWRFEQTMDQDYTAKGPNGVFLIRSGLDLSPGAGALPVNVAEWYMAKVASLNAFAKNATLTANQTQLDEAYQVCLRINKSIGYSVTRPQMYRADPVSVHSMKVLMILQESVESLETRLFAEGAHSSVQSEADAMPVAQKVSSLEDGSSDVIQSILRGEGICNDVLPAIAQLKASLVDEPGSNVGGTLSLESRVLAVQHEIGEMCRHFEALDYDGDAMNIDGQHSLYVIDDTIDLVPPASILPAAVVEWYMPKVASFNKLAIKAMATNQSLQAVYLVSLRLTMGMELTMERPMMKKNELASCLHAQKVMQVFQQNADEVRKELLARGASQYGWDEESESEARAAFLFSQIGESHLEQYGEQKTTELEDSGVKMLEDIFNFSLQVQQTSVDEFVANVSKFRQFLLKNSVFETHGRTFFLERANATQSEVLKTWHQKAILHEDMAAKGPQGLYAVEPTLDLVLAKGTTPQVAIDWCLAKTMSFACLAHKAIHTQERLDEAETLSVNLLSALSTMAKHTNMQEQHTKNILGVLQHTVNDVYCRIRDAVTKLTVPPPVGNETQQDVSDEIMDAAARQESQILAAGFHGDDGAS